MKPYLAELKKRWYLITHVYISSIILVQEYFSTVCYISSSLNEWIKIKIVSFQNDDSKSVYPEMFSKDN
jgi:hypothetical protein